MQLMQVQAALMSQPCPQLCTQCIAWQAASSQIGHHLNCVPLCAPPVLNRLQASSAYTPNKLYACIRGLC